MKAAVLGTVSRPRWLLPGALSFLTHAAVLSLLPATPPTSAAPHDIIAMHIREPPSPIPDAPSALLPEKPPTPTTNAKVRAPTSKPAPPSEISARANDPPPSEPARALGTDSAPTPTGGEGLVAPAVTEGSGPLVRGEGDGAPKASTDGETGWTTRSARDRDRGAARADLKAYQRGIYEAVQGGRRYPPAARHLGLEGRTVLRISVDRAGRLTAKPKIAESSSHEILDLEAIRMVEAASPFPPLPTAYERSEAEFLIPIRFRLEE